MGYKVKSATVYPPEGGAVKHEVGKSGVSNIKIHVNTLGADGIWVIFENGRETVYLNMPFSYDSEKAVRKGR